VESTPPPSLTDVESAYLAAREADDRRVVARMAGTDVPSGDVELAAAQAALAALDRESLSSEDLRVVAAMEAGLARMAEHHAAASGSPLEAAYTAAADSLAVGGERRSRLAILGRLARDPDPVARRGLFLALEPLWHAVDGDGGADSPYRAFVADPAHRPAAGGDPPIVEWCEAILDAWRAATAGSAIEPWDWWWVNGELERLTAPLLSVERLRPISDAYHAALGADVEALDIAFDVEPRPGRPPLPLAETVFDGRPHRRADGHWSRGRPTVFATYAGGGLGELTELIHETGHAIHIAAIRTRPAYADWPDSNILTEAIADLLAWDAYRPEWLRRWVSPDIGEIANAAVSRATFAGVAMDAAWALLEARLLDDPSARPNDVWTDVTGRYFGIVPHPEWSWWAIRGQLVQEVGYMANYALGAVLTAGIRAALRAVRGDWIEGDTGWYGYVSERLLRFGLERPSVDVVRELLGREPSPAALLDEIAGR
jgi:hypothetical protein